MIDLDDFRWSSDWNGYEVGFPDVEAVGLYSMSKYPIDVYIDCSNGWILEAWCTSEEE